MACTRTVFCGIAASRVAFTLLRNVNQKVYLPVSTCYLSHHARRITTSSLLQAAGNESDDEGTSMTIQGYFASKDRTKESFLIACDVFKSRGPHLRGHVEFIYAAMKYMEEYGVHKDLEVYKKLLDLMPKGKMIPRNLFQAEFMHYPKQQFCAIDCLEQMEINGVMPDTEIEHILRNTFGKYGHPVRKYARMMYWMPKFKNASPWRLPDIVPNDAFELAKMAVARMCSVDPSSTISVFETKDVEDALEDTWIVSGQSPVQQELVEKHLLEEPIKVEGPFRIYLRDKCVGYFILRAEAKPLPPPVEKEVIDDVGSIKHWFTGEFEPKDVAMTKPPSVHEQEDGTILAICATGTSGRDSLLSWIRLLQSTNPKLASIPVLFTQASPIGDVMTTGQQNEAASVETAS
nr:evolutionarily conserved signaling intermediate in Toll pathway, mitochondrial-like [Procambarus clarkii]XP_045608015.1 evolutionarily conserved signaling intermediate in Toll pathway, mitochondrial-like [Procambarus clarkii]XP_045608016.1 evolutionarily conserved signaling intermediate in Toll pathway, mitochondrial-like [Procambarus clarkii]XP_045608017.1 evolutionarily conserved signaling intermediate in Toll pathway, mitochondrial-like [Procambarus clarkii]XP_045608018.1 evolutionarily c